MNIIICDDENMCIEDIRQKVDDYLSRHFQTALFDTYTDGSKVLENNLKYYDMAFLDIEMGNIKGTDIARKLKEINPHIVIFFVTAFNRYLDVAMDLDAFRFFPKPLDTDRLYDSLDRAMELIDKTVIEFMLKDSDGINKITASEIAFVEIVGRFTKVVTDSEIYISENSIKFWQEKLVASYFYRVHKSFIINMNHITKYKRDRIIVDKKFVIPIANKKRAQFRQCFLRKIEGR